MHPADLEFARDLLELVDASPTPYHAVANLRAGLEAAGFTALDPAAAWSGPGGRELVAVGGTLVAWAVPDGASPATPFRIVGAHTDSPNLRLKPRPDTGGSGFRQLGVEVYGGVLLNSWLDRDLGIAGRVAVRGPAGPDLRLLHVGEPVARIPQLAIHLDRDVNERGLALDRQLHLAPVWGTGTPEVGGFGRWVAERLGVDVDDVLGWDLMFHDLVPGSFLGADRSMLSAPRLDNLLSCHAAVRALVDAVERPAGGDAPIPVVVLFDHEEIGSTSAVGATSTLLRTVLERLVGRRGGDAEDLARALAGSLVVSADNAHATHPNYPERHEPAHPVRCNGGPVVKRNAQVRYATDAGTEAQVVLAAERAGVPLQQFVVRSNLPCGSTIGPLTAAALGVPTVDVGIAQLAMHSARELAGAHDPARLAALLAELLHPTR
jgi:aspartyl aminopeptidase